MLQHIVIRSVALVLGILIFGCASDQPRVKYERKFGGTQLDIKKLKYVDLKTGRTVNAGEFMEFNDLDAMFLMFGSANCAKCNHKAKDFTKKSLRGHNLFHGRYSESFALIGVTTDFGASKKEFDSLWLNQKERKKRGYDIYQWHDAKGETVKRYFLKKGEFFGLPYAVLLTREGILMRVDNHDQRTLAQLLDAVEAKLEGREPDPEPTHQPTHGPEVPKDFPRHLFALADRFSEIKASDCAQKNVSLDTHLKPANVRVLQIVPADCLTECRANLSTLEQWSSSCGRNGSCAHFTLSQKGIPADLCEKTSIATGGSSLIRDFSYLFNWRFSPDLNEQGDPVAIPAVGRPMVLAFNASGRILLAEMGTVAASDLAALSPDQPSPRVQDWPLYGDNRKGDKIGNVSVADIIPQSQFTVFVNFDFYCTGCIEELALQSQPGPKYLYDYCAKHPSFCQVYALERKYMPYDYGMSIEEGYDFGKDLFRSNLEENGGAVRVPLLIEREAIPGNYTRFSDGYLVPLFPNWDHNFGSVIMDKEGKIIADFKSEGAVEVDPILATLKKLEGIHE